MKVHKLKCGSSERFIWEEFLEISKLVTPNISQVLLINKTILILQPPQFNEPYF